MFWLVTETGLGFGPQILHIDQRPDPSRMQQGAGRVALFRERLRVFVVGPI
jgi:hypothetical protein